jgi:predicted ATPase
MYLEGFVLPNDMEEFRYLGYQSHESAMQCYNHGSVYPFKLFPSKQLESIRFAPITIFYGSNGSGKSTLLNIIGEKLGIERRAPFNHTPYFDSYLKFCRPMYPPGKYQVPFGSKMITSDDVFEYLLNVRAINQGIEDRRSQLAEEYRLAFKEETQNLKSLDDIDEYLRVYEIKHSTKSQFITRRGVSREVIGKSNGESAFSYFTDKITERCLYLLDEPENSLAPKLQRELLQFIGDSVRFYGCQFIIATHSPFLLSLKDALIYDLDSNPVITKKWTELTGVRTYYDFFKEHAKEFGN